MLINPLARFAIALSIGLAALPARAQTRSPDGDFQRAQQELRKSLHGWPGGVVFTCAIVASGQPADLVRQICADAAASAKTLAGRAKAKFTQVPDVRTFEAETQRQHALGLTVQLFPTDFNAPLAAVTARLVASRFYPDVVSAGARANLKAAPQEPMAVPRIATVVFWEEALVASGPPSPQLVSGVAGAISQKLDEFFAAYAGS